MLSANTYGAVITNGDIGLRRQAQQQAGPAASPVQRQEIHAGRDGVKHRRAGAQHRPGGLPATPPTGQGHPVTGAGPGEAHPTATYALAAADAQVMARLPLLLQAEGPAVGQLEWGLYWLTFALTRYSPATTPPNK